MDAACEKEDFKVKITRFKTTSKTDKDAIFNARKAENTNRATRTWLTCLMNISLKRTSNLDQKLTNAELTAILPDFYIELRKKKV